MLRHRKKHSNALNHLNSFQSMKAENGDNNGSSINNSASDMSDDESTTLAMINNKKLMEMMPKADQDAPNQFNKELFMKLQEKFFSMQGSNLLGNLLGISDQGMLNKMFSSSADEAAKLLGVEK
jgi:ras-responsive element-binding protein 1